LSYIQHLSKSDDARIDEKEEIGKVVKPFYLVDIHATEKMSQS